MFLCLNNAAVKNNIVDKSLFPFWFFSKLFEEVLLGPQGYIPFLSSSIPSAKLLSTLAMSFFLIHQT